MQRWLPVAYFFLAVALVVAVLPSALRPPPQQPPSSAEFAPDAPPDDSQALIASLNRGNTATAGAGTPTQVAAGVGPGAASATTAPPRIGKPARGRCYGNPPRQIESLYAGPCVPAFEGDNGGSTYKHVSRDMVKVGLYHPTDGCDGYAPTEPTDNEGSAARTMRVLQAYMNANVESYGRTIRLFCMKGGESDTAMHDNAVTAEAEDLFVTYYTSLGYCREMVRLQMPVLCDPPGRQELLDGDPYFWSYQMDRTTMEEFGAEWVCKQLKDRNASFAGPASGYRSSPRKFGLISEDTTETGIKAESQVAALKRECGIDVSDNVVIYQTSFDTQNISTGLAKLRSAGVTSVIFNVKFLNTLQTFQAADSVSYEPEWLIFSPWGLDVNIIGTLMPQNQMRQVMGLSGYEWPRPGPETECYRAYKTMDPNNTPDAFVCGTLWDPLVQMMNGISGAGPDLNPEHFKEGMFKLGHRYYEDIPYAIGGGYGPGDYSYIDNVGLIWWDGAAQKPDGSPGAYRWVRCGTRYKKGEIPREDPLLFSDGGVGPGLNGCPKTREPT